jgi:integrase
VMRHAGDRVHGRRLRALIGVLWRAGLADSRASRSPKPTWIRAADRCSCAGARAAAAAKSGWTTGPELRHLARGAGVRRRFAPHQLRHAHAVEVAREGVPLIVIQRQLGHTNLGITSIYLQGIDNAEIIDTGHARRAPMIPVHSSLRV